MQQRVEINDAVVEADLGDEAVLLNVETATYFGLDETGTTIWSLLRQGASEEAIVEHIVRAHDVGPDEVRGDLASFLGQLVEKGLARRIVA
jgi:hypothetical protein